MLCTTCNRESKNLRVCPYCFTPYPPEAIAAARRTPHRSGTTGDITPVVKAAATDGWQRASAWMVRQPLSLRIAGGTLVLAVLLWLIVPGEQVDRPVVLPSDITATPMQRAEAEALLRQTRQNALVDVQQDEVFVSYPEATFPALEAGRLALAREFAQADEIVEGRKRRINFYDPSGKLFAQSDAIEGLRIIR